jgi:hypothetical protein
VGVELGLQSSWHPSLPFLVVKNLLSVLPAGRTASLRLRASGGTFTVDDVYVDPYGKR